MRSLVLRVDRSVATDVRAPVRIPGLCAGAVGGLPPPPPPGFAAAPPISTLSGANAAAAAAAPAVDDAVSPEGSDNDGLVVTGAVATRIGEAILKSRNPRSAFLTCGTAARGGLKVCDAEDLKKRLTVSVAEIENKGLIGLCACRSCRAVPTGQTVKGKTINHR